MLAIAETFDADGSGAVSIHEFEEALTKLAKDREEHGRQTSGGALTRRTLRRGELGFLNKGAI